MSPVSDSKFYQLRMNRAWSAALNRFAAVSPGARPFPVFVLEYPGGRKKSIKPHDFFSESCPKIKIILP
jgi:hypothetical protein